VLSGSNSFLNLLCRQPQISAGHDVVTIKNIARFVSADRHRYALRHTAPDHVEIEFWTRVNAAHPSCADLETKWQHDLEFLGMTVDDVLRTDREFVREAWSKISAVADVLDAGYVIVPRMKWIEAAQCFEEAIPA